MDCVYIATPLFQHFPVTRDALLAGKHVFCEKSLVFKPEEIHQIGLREVARIDSDRSSGFTPAIHRGDTIVVFDGTMPEWGERADRSEPLAFIDSCLRGVGQVVFMNNPLTGLIGQAQLLLREELSDAARRRVLTIEQLANRIRDTVASLREIQTPLPPSHAGEGSEDPPRH